MELRTGFREMLGIEGPLTRETLERALFDYLIRGAINPRQAGLEADRGQASRGDPPPPAGEDGASGGRM